ncbi:HET-domain-containing protein [Thozetella sp. PMI_491]|nr:HET-domain-containing protein [Thozetella sp. PMI_491]
MSYPYRPLLCTKGAREVRLITLHALSSPDATISCELQHWSIDNPPSFLALSYTWQSAFADAAVTDTKVDQLETISIDGRAVSVGKNLAQALQTLAGQLRGCLLWADAICINQVDLDERASQVAMMGDIYTRAETVVVWLGEPRDDAGLAFELLRQLSEIKADSDQKKMTMELVGNPDLRLAWKAFYCLMERSWWTRTWVLQEVILAREIKVFCGRLSILGDSFFRAFATLASVSHLVPFSKICFHMNGGGVFGFFKLRRLRASGRRLTLPYCHLRTLASTATDPRDYIYAKLGFASDATFITPDYRASVAEVYTKCVAGYMLATNSLDIIHMDALPRTTPGLPSWVPDWSASYRVNPLLEYSDPTTILPNYLGRKARTLLDNGLSDGVLQCCGNIYDVVDGTSYSPISKAIANDNLSEDQPTSTSRIYQESETFTVLGATLMAYGFYLERKPIDLAALSALASAMCDADDYLNERASTKLPIRYASSFEADYNSIRHFCVYGMTIKEWARQENQTHRIGSEDTKAEDVQDFVVATMNLRRLVTTGKGYIGVASRNTKRGDLVFKIEGSSLPVILREIGDKYVLVGHAYVHGLMEYDSETGTASTKFFQII